MTNHYKNAKCAKRVPKTEGIPFNNLEEFCLNKINVYLQKRIEPSAMRKSPWVKVRRLKEQASGTSGKTIQLTEPDVPTH